LSDHLVQKGPAFKRAMDVSIDGATGEVAVRYTDDDGKEKAITERLKLPADVSNGMTLTVLKNIQPGRHANDTSDGCGYAETAPGKAGDHAAR
jgi:hypothetical protein